MVRNPQVSHTLKTFQMLEKAIWKPYFISLSKREWKSNSHLYPLLQKFKSEYNIPVNSDVLRREQNPSQSIHCWRNKELILNKSRNIKC